MNIRQARRKDREEIQSLYLELTDSKDVSILEDRIESIFRDENNYLIVAEDHAKVKGTAFVTMCLDPMYNYQPYAVVENFIVNSTCRGSGIGTKLIKFIDQLCLDNDCSKIMLLSSSTRNSAHEFFNKNGFSCDTKLGFVKYRRSLLASNA